MVEAKKYSKKLVDIGGSIYLPLDKHERHFHNEGQPEPISAKTHLAIVENSLVNGKKCSILTFEKKPEVPAEAPVVAVVTAPPAAALRNVASVVEAAWEKAKGEPPENV